MGNTASFLADIAILRLFAIIIVAAFHVYGMTYANHLPPPIAELYKSVYESVTSCGLIRVAMPLFVLISGYLFAMQIINGKFSGFKQMLLNKSQRILLPYYIFTILFSLTYSGWDWKPFYTGGYWHLWFLPMLMWLFILLFLIRKPLLYGNPIWLCLALIITFLLMIPDRFIPMILGAHNVSKWAFWFVLGFALFRYDDKIGKAIKKFHLAIPMILIYLMITYFFPTEYGKVTWYSELASLCAVISLSYLARQVDWQKYNITKYLVRFSSCSFGIYIFHNWIAVYLISTTAQKYFPIAAFAKEHIVLFPLIFSMIVILLSFFLTYLIRSNKYGKMLIG